MVALGQDVLLYIFNIVAEPYRGNTYSLDRFRPVRDLYPALFVSRDWHSIAEHVLYRTIGMGEDKHYLADDDICSTDSTPAMLRASLESNPRLAGLVRCLNMSTNEHDRQETIDQAAIIRLCPNVLHVVYWGYNAHELDSVRAALLGKRKLQSLSLSRFGLMDTKGNGFCCASYLIRMMACWPDLVKVHGENCCLAPGTHEGALESKALEEAQIQLRQLPSPLLQPLLTTPLPPVAACVNLRTISLGYVSITSEDVEQLARLAPNIVKCNLGCEGYSLSGASLSYALRQWAPTLRHLTLGCSTRGSNLEAPDLSIDHAFSALIHLEGADISWKHVAPLTLAKAPPLLEYLRYATTSAGLSQLANVLSEPAAAPSFRRIRVRFDKEGQKPWGRGPIKFDDLTLARFKKVCAARGIEVRTRATPSCALDSDEFNTENW
jgi:hypothetical protein